MARSKEVGQGRLNSDQRGGLGEMISPYSRAPLKNDVVPFDQVPSPKMRDPLGYMPNENPKGESNKR